MKLTDLQHYRSITIQCHDNPDADAIASGFALYTYFASLGKEVRLVYAGRNRIQKPNLLLMVEKLHIPIIYIDDVAKYMEKEPKGKIQGLHFTTGCIRTQINFQRYTIRWIWICGMRFPVRRR